MGQAQLAHVDPLPNLGNPVLLVLQLSAPALGWMEGLWVSLPGVGRREEEEEGSMAADLILFSTHGT